MIDYEKVPGTVALSTKTTFFPHLNDEYIYIQVSTVSTFLLSSLCVFKNRLHISLTVFISSIYFQNRSHSKSRPQTFPNQNKDTAKVLKDLSWNCKCEQQEHWCNPKGFFHWGRLVGTNPACNFQLFSVDFVQS